MAVVGRSDLPAAVVEYQIGDHLTPLQIQATEVGKPLEAAALEHRGALARVVEAHHRGQEHALSAAQNAQGVVEFQQVRTQVPLAGGTAQAFAGAIAKPLGPGDFRTAFPSLEKGLGRTLEMARFTHDLIDDVGW